MRILVLGAYGLIGRSVSYRLLQDGHTLVGLARSRSRGMALIPEADWIGVDLASLKRSSDWLPHLDGINVVVNASGVLQGGLNRQVVDTQHIAITALIEACKQAGVTRFVQISAPGVSVDATTEFYRSKARADTSLKSSALSWTILRPGLVLSPQSYGGTALLRMLAAVPWIQPIFMADAPVQTVHIEDVAQAVSISVKGALNGRDIDLVESESHSLLDVVLNFRRWLGFKPALYIWRVPAWLGWMTAKLADLAGWLGWQSALRSTSLTVISNGVTGDAEDGRELFDRSLRSLRASLRSLPSTRQERISARLSLVYPVLVATLSLFWVASGVIGLIRHEAALQVLPAAVPDELSWLAVFGGAILDIGVGALIAFRPTVRAGCTASFILGTAYLIASAVLTPSLWADPMGPMVKVFPALALALGVAALSEAR